MELYILDSLYRRVTVVDKFKSLIWTDRFAAYGDFELDLFSTQANRGLFTMGTKLALTESDRVMVVETVENSVADDGSRVLKVTGRSLESVFDNRLARGVLGDTTTTPTWELTGTPPEIATQMVNDICVTGVLDPGDVIPLLSLGSISPPDTIPPPSASITLDVDLQTLYSAMTNLCGQYLMGFRISRNADFAQLYFNVYMGSDRTIHQSDLPAVLFSSELDNLQDTSELKSIATYKNVAYVISPVGSEVVYADNVDPSTIGVDRRVVIVQADDITDTDPTTASNQMIAAGQAALAQARQVQSFDGETSQISQYKYGRDYNLGDLLSVANDDGLVNDMQVTEQIFVSDNQGDRSYPTLSLYEFVTPGSWLALPADKHWYDFTTEHWSEM